MIVLQNISEKLSKKCTPDDIEKVVKPMMGKMAELCNEPLGNHTSGALALAHCQVDQENPLRFFVLRGGVAIVNPHINERIGKEKGFYEGCMSFAHKLRRLTRRYRKVKVSYTEILPTGEITERKEITVDGELAIIFQHEIGHMDGRHIY